MKAISKKLLSQYDPRLTVDHVITKLMILGIVTYDRSGNLVSAFPELVIGKRGGLKFDKDFIDVLNDVTFDLSGILNNNDDCLEILDFDYKSKFIPASKFCSEHNVSRETLEQYVYSGKPCVRSYKYDTETHGLELLDTLSPINYYRKGKTLYVQVKSYKELIVEHNDLNFDEITNKLWSSLSALCTEYDASPKQIKSLLVEEGLIKVNSKYKVTWFNPDFIKFIGKKMIVCVQNPFTVLPSQVGRRFITCHLHELLEGVGKRIISGTIKAKRTKITKSEVLDRDLRQMKSRHYEGQGYVETEDLRDNEDLSSYVFAQDYSVKDVRALFKAVSDYGCYIGFHDYANEVGSGVTVGHYVLENAEDYLILLDFAFLGYSKRKPSQNIPYIHFECWDSKFSTVVGMQRPYCPFDFQSNQRLYQVLLA